MRIAYDCQQWGSYALLGKPRNELWTDIQDIAGAWIYELAWKTQERIRRLPGLVSKVEARTFHPLTDNY